MASMSDKDSSRAGTTAVVGAGAATGEGEKTGGSRGGPGAACAESRSISPRRERATV